MNRKQFSKFLLLYITNQGISFGRNGKHTTVASAWRCGAENPFARSEPGSVASSPEGSESPITAARGCCKQPTGFFRQIFLVVEPKTDFSEKFQYGVNCSVFATLHLTLSALCFTVKKRKKSCRNFIFSTRKSRFCNVGCVRES